jgi:hypothetical protein
MSYALHCILHMMWAWNKDSRHVSPTTDRQTVQAQKCTDMWGHETNSKLCLRNTTVSGVQDFIVISLKSCVFYLQKCFVIKHCVYYIFIMPTKCLNHPDTCYLYGEMTFKYKTWNFTLLSKKCYELYFGCKVGDQHKSWTPHIYCVMCMRFLTG